VALFYGQSPERKTQRRLCHCLSFADPAAMQPINLRYRLLISLHKETEINLETIIRYYRIDPKEISFLKFILEAYDGLAVVTTLDSFDGIISITIAPGCIQDAEKIIQGLKDEIMIEEVDSFVKSINFDGKEKSSSSRRTNSEE
jgi:hypothetical protein